MEYFTGKALQWEGDDWDDSDDDDFDEVLEEDDDDDDDDEDECESQTTHADKNQH